ncbi:unnamed protein product, partial [Prorocentrum cordatum]
AVLEVWATGASYEEAVADALAAGGAAARARRRRFLAPPLTFQIRFAAFGRTATMEDKGRYLELLRPLFEGDEASHSRPRAAASSIQEKGTYIADIEKVLKKHRTTSRRNNIQPRQKSRQLRFVLQRTQISSLQQGDEAQQHEIDMYKQTEAACREWNAIHQRLAEEAAQELFYAQQVFDQLEEALSTDEVFSDTEGIITFPQRVEPMLTQGRVRPDQSIPPKAARNYHTFRHVDNIMNVFAARSALHHQPRFLTGLPAHVAVAWHVGLAVLPTLGQLRTAEVGASDASTALTGKRGRRLDELHRCARETRRAGTSQLRSRASDATASYAHQHLFTKMSKASGYASTVTAAEPGAFGVKLQAPHVSNAACHQARVAHRDVKPDNYLICPDGNTVKLCDFSSCALLPPNGSVAGEFGTAPFMSPEMLTAQHGLATDVYSYGVAAYFMLFGELPYIPERITSRAAKAATRAGVPAPRFLEPVPGDPSGSVGFCRGLLQRDPSQRCSAGDALGHSYFQVLFDAKKGPAMPDTQSTLDPFEAPALESDDLESDSEGTCTPRLSQVSASP